MTKLVNGLNRSALIATAALLALPLAACGGGSSTENNPGKPATSATSADPEMDLAFAKIELGRVQKTAKALLSSTKDKLAPEVTKTLADLQDKAGQTLSGTPDTATLAALKAELQTELGKVEGEFLKYAKAKLEAAVAAGEKALADFPNGDPTARTRLTTLLEDGKRAAGNASLNATFLDGRAAEIAKETAIVSGQAPAKPAKTDS